MDTRFVWNQRKAATNLLKHGVSFEDAANAFQDTFGITTYDTNYPDEDRFILLALSPRLRVLFVVHIQMTPNVTRIISARKASSHERAQYEKNLS